MIDLDDSKNYVHLDLIQHQTCSNKEEGSLFFFSSQRRKQEKIKHKIIIHIKRTQIINEGEKIQLM